ncbi:Pimeloyl-ACP methyl ester carboxylesterase [Pseudooceanicola antarcticus]|uniref:Pimeloyl-ACP methyl ester carboxylesterase n=2 Tax=Pseudooceanicola antarcticus TaxID=1247613 RepID=A0A285IP58_9RHOB|nr:Pimeloyl-ACP methyl ester carboxylesterase [Pseudooceanicola antarcticus]
MRSEGRYLWGKEGRKVLMLHCSLAHGGAWAGMARALPVQALAVDLPGHGQGPEWDEGQSFQLQARRLAEAAAEDFGAPLDVLGHSFGATVALRLAVDRPDLVRSLALYEPVFFTPAFRAFPGLEAHHNAQLAPYQQAWEAGDREGAARAFMAVWGDGRPWEALPEAQRRSFAERVHLINAIRDTNYGDPVGMLSEKRLAGLSCPVLLMDGSESPIYVSRINAALQAEMPWARRSVIEGTGHMGPLSHPGAVAREVQNFWAECESPVSG